MDIPEIPEFDIPIESGVLQEILMPRWNLKLADDLYFSPNYLSAIAIVFLLFLLTLSMARLRRMYVKWSFKGATGMVAMGFLLALIVEGFFIVGGRTMFTELLGWKNPPKPISTALDTGKERLVDVLGEQSEVASSSAALKIDSEMIINGYGQLSENEADEVKQFVCSEQ